MPKDKDEPVRMEGVYRGVDERLGGNDNPIPKAVKEQNGPGA
jgi:hypothetical protein